MTGTPGPPVTAIAIPYLQWDNRDGGPMRVWIPPGLGPDAVKVLEGKLVEVLVGQAPLGQRGHVSAGLADVAPGLAGG